MKNWPGLLLVVTVGAALLCGQAFAGATQSSVASFAQLRKMVVGLGEPRHTLLVMDDDDTLTMMPCPKQGGGQACQYLGGPAWFAWQEGLLKERRDSFRVADNMNDLIGVAALLLDLNRMVYTEPDVPVVLHDLSQSGVRLLVLTARGPANLSATEKQFSSLSLGSGKTDFLALVENNALVGKKSGIASIAGPFLPQGCGASHPRPVSYQQGVMYVAGQNKGKMLECLLARTRSSAIHNIVFIDDTGANVVDVYMAFRNSGRFHVRALHYTALERHKEALTEGPRARVYQERARARWHRIRDVLTKALRAPAIPAPLRP